MGETALAAPSPDDFSNDAYDNCSEEAQNECL
jgi:hypothetical protein